MQYPAFLCSLITWVFSSLPQTVRSVTAAATRRTRRLSAATKNRRLAQLQRLMDRGDYFSDDAMRTRAPLLHHHYVAQVTCVLSARQSMLSLLLLTMFWLPAIQPVWASEPSCYLHAPPARH